MQRLHERGCIMLKGSVEGLHFQLQFEPATYLLYLALAFWSVMIKLLIFLYFSFWIYWQLLVRFWHNSHNCEIRSQIFPFSFVGAVCFSFSFKMFIHLFFSTYFENVISSALIQSFPKLEEQYLFPWCRKHLFLPWQTDEHKK